MGMARQPCSIIPLSIGLIHDDNEGAYREEVEGLVDWCNTKSLVLNVGKTKRSLLFLEKADTFVGVVNTIKFLVCRKWVG